MKYGCVSILLSLPMLVSGADLRIALPDDSPVQRVVVKGSWDNWTTEIPAVPAGGRIYVVSVPVMDGIYQYKLMVTPLEGDPYSITDPSNHFYGFGADRTTNSAFAVVAGHGGYIARACSGSGWTV